MSARICVGNYAANAYHFEGLNVNVYCMEELCYCLKENAFLLDMDLMNDRLVDWIGRECGQTALAGELYPLVHRKGSLSAFVCRILYDTGFYEDCVVRNVEQMLKKGAGLDGLEKRKLRIDHLVGQKQYQAALKEYNVLLNFWEEANERGERPLQTLRAAILHNKGMAYVGLMQYADAAECFDQAYHADGSKESLKCMLAAKRMGLDDKEYVSYAATLTGASDLVMELEQEIQQLNGAWEEETDYLRLRQREKLKTEEEALYQAECDRTLQVLKESYRKTQT